MIKPYYEEPSGKLYLGDCLSVMRELPDNSVDSIVSDPPYGISFMSKYWDYDVPKVEVWQECLRVLKPGGHALIACGTRTQHRMCVNIEDAGFEIRDIVAWVYGSGFPKSLNIGKAIDGKLGKQGKGFNTAGDDGREAKFKQDLSKRSDYGYKFIPESDKAKKWKGWGTALKPACELWTLARKPLSEKTIAQNMLKWGCGGINIDGCRVGNENVGARPRTETENCPTNMLGCNGKKDFKGQETQGRFPANLIHDGSDEVVGLFPDTKSGARTGGDKYKLGRFDKQKGARGLKIGGACVASSGSAARFFYCAKASKSERNKGCEQIEKGNNHSTVKPITLMRYLCKLITPPNGTILDPFMGSGSTGIAAKLEGFDFIGIEKEEEYCEIAEARIKAWKPEDKQESLF